MIDNLLIAIHAFLMYMLILLSVDADECELVY